MHTRHQLRNRRILFSVLMLAMGPWLVGCAGKCAPVPTDEVAAVLTAEQILEKSLEAHGGKDAHAKLHNSVSKGTFGIPAMGLTGTLTSYHAEPRSLRTEIELAGMGQILSGGNGETYYETSLMQGTSIKEGEERAAAVRDATFNPALNWREMYPDVALAGIDTLDGTVCYRLLLTPVEGSPVTAYYDLETWLPFKTQAEVTTQMGKISVEIYLSDYREVAGVLAAHNVRMILMGMQEMVMQIETIEFNVELPEDIFALPDEVQALLTE